MTEMVRIGSRGGLSSAVHIRAIGVDDLVHVRYVHSAALRVMEIDEVVSADEAALLQHHINSTAHTDTLMGLAQDGRLLGGWIGSELAGAVAWECSPDAGIASIEHVIVQPLFRKAGIGRHLVAEIERRARRSGTEEMVVSAPAPAAAFFQLMGYRPVSCHTDKIGGVELQVVAMRKLRGSIPVATRLLH